METLFTIEDENGDIFLRIRSSSIVEFLCLSSTFFINYHILIKP